MRYIIIGDYVYKRAEDELPSPNDPVEKELDEEEAERTIPSRTHLPTPSGGRRRTDRRAPSQ